MCADDLTFSFQPNELQKKIFDRINECLNSTSFSVDSDEDDFDISPTLSCEYYTLDDFKASNISAKRHFSILHHNIHSIQCHIEAIRTMLNLLDFRFDILCFSESKLQKDVNPAVQINIHGYQNPLSVPTEAQKGGVLIYVKEGIIFKPRLDLNMYKKCELESCFLEIVNQKSVNDIVGVVYRHPVMNVNIFIDDYLVPLTEKLSKQKKNIYICGDFNFNLLNLSHSGTMDFIEQMLSNFLLPVISKPTKLNNSNNHTLIDNIFINNISPETKSGNLAVDTPDGHLPSFMITPRPNQNFLPKKHNKFVRDIKNLNYESLIDDWDAIIDSSRNDVNYSAENFFENFNILLDKHAPLRKLTNKAYKHSFKPWIDSTITNRIKKKQVIKKTC